ncbi:MAG: ion transporter [Gammaproteobacteria bacterium]|nr:ion transporter [Gammaproteobacteria bacterium]CAJ2376494.1 MAG: putative Potassium voltage-gated channel subfamily KQT; potassium channel, VIC family [Arenicellales bacterium IbO2]MDA7961546.1 ion transporter [Gammaproteobacteria bacterium]MDA7969761.1 ion transporter [Gammaproteobacteria bacterium]MDA7972119.1 ion transporter [Gammaproteobacteria bacterium]
MPAAPLRKIIDRAGHEADGRAGRAFALAVQILIVVSLVAFSIETLPNLPEAARRALHVMEIVIVAAFTAEYALRVIAAERKAKFIFSFYGLIDLAAILPFYLAAAGVDLRALRAFRLLRVARILKLVAYDRAASRFRRALRIAREELILFGGVAAVMLYLSAAGIYYFENAAQPDAFQSVFHSLWWALVTLTTVGYGDMVPVTFGGRALTFVMLTTGIGIVAVPTGLIASALSRVRAEDAAGAAKKKKKKK